MSEESQASGIDNMIRERNNEFRGRVKPSKIKEPIKTYTAQELDEARKMGWEACENQYSLVIKNLKDEIKRLKNGTIET